MPFKFEVRLDQYVTNLLTLNVRGQYITLQISLGENKSPWRSK